MDDKTYEALKAEKFSNITFSAPELSVSGNQITGMGQLELAGVKKPFQIAAEKVESTDDNITIKGEVSLNMTDFGVTPPTAMFGTIETGELVKITYQLLINKQ